VGHWSLTKAGHEFSYQPSWVESREGRVLSLSLPFTPGNAPHRGEVVRNYFENLLPDRPEIRNRLRDRFRAASAQAFDLLAEVGRDCVGAIQLLPDNQASEKLKSILGQPLDDQDVARALAVAGGLASADQDRDDFRLSLAGAQEKTAILWNDGGWQRPLGATPSTHIFKLPLGTIAGRLPRRSTKATGGPGSVPRWEFSMGQHTGPGTERTSSGPSSSFGCSLPPTATPRTSVCS